MTSRPWSRLALCAWVLLSGCTAAWAWGNHSLLSYRALEVMPEVAQAAPVAAEPLDAFLRAEEPAIAKLLAEQEAWARANFKHYPSRPDLLAFSADPASPDASRRMAFLAALRVSQQAKFALFRQIDARRERGELPPPLAVEQVSPVPPSKGATQRFVALQPGEPVAPLAVLASASDEPDYGLDLNLFDDNRGNPGYGFGKQPFGNPAVAIGSQAPFHMGFFHQGSVFNTLAPGFTRTFTEMRVQQYTGLAALAFRTGHPYWGWRFTGLALHHVQDLTQPYHASAAPGSGLGHMMWVNLLDKLGMPDGRRGLVVLQSNRHFVLENVQVRLVLANAQAGRDGPLEAALRDTARDARYPPWSPAYTREVVAAQAHAAGPETDAAVVVGVPARYVMDPDYDFAASEAQTDLGADMARQLASQRDTLQAAIARLLGHFGAHSRNLVRGILQGSVRP